MNHRLIALFLALLGWTFLVSSAKAQRHGGFAPAGASRTAISPGFGGRANFARLRRVRRFARSSAYAPYYYYSDYDYLDYDSGPGPEPGMIEAPPPSSSPRSPLPRRPRRTRPSLYCLNYKAITGSALQTTASRRLARNPASWRRSRYPIHQPASPRRIQASEPPSQLPPATLVFRDGHTEEIGKYMIVGKTIHIRVNYWTSGSWTKTVQIAQFGHSRNPETQSGPWRKI